MEDSGNQLDFNFAADDLLELPRDLGETGYFQFSSERRQAIRALAEKFNVPLNQRVHLSLKGTSGVLEGKLMLDSLLLPRLCDQSITLRLGNVVFENTEIESCKKSS